MRPVVGVGKLMLGEHYAPVNRLEPIPRIRNCAPDDYRERIFKIGLTQLLSMLTWGKVSCSDMIARFDSG